MNCSLFNSLFYSPPSFEVKAARSGSRVQSYVCEKSFSHLLPGLGEGRRREPHVSAATPEELAGAAGEPAAPRAARAYPRRDAAREPERRAELMTGGGWCMHA